MTYDFNTKAEYLAATTMWKADFKAHIEYIRQLKRDFKDAQRKFSVIGGYRYNWTAEERKLYFATYRPMEDIRTARQKAGEKTADMHTTRSRMKEEAQEQYLAQK